MQNWVVVLFLKNAFFEKCLFWKTKWVVFEKCFFWKTNTKTNAFFFEKKHVTTEKPCMFFWKKVFVFEKKNKPPKTFALQRPATTMSSSEDEIDRGEINNTQQNKWCLPLHFTGRRKKNTLCQTHLLLVFFQKRDEIGCYVCLLLFLYIINPQFRPTTTTHFSLLT